MNEQAIFLAALDIANPAERLAYVNRNCAGDATLRQQVEELLAAHERPGEFLNVPALQQIAAGSPEGWRPPAEPSVEQDIARGEIDLSFLQPSTKIGSLGRLGHYEVQEIIGRGGCGIVLKAFDEMLHRVAAIKVMIPELASTSPARKRFLREARAAAAIRHDNVVNIYSVEEQPIPFLVMEYIAGQTLQQKLDQTGPLDVLEVLRIGHQIALGLQAAHEMGLIHRDIKPGNILLEKGRDRVKITDFGLARASDDASLTQSGAISGTPLYMSPEQAQGDVIDQRSDLFSLGSVLYVMCSGRPPFRAATTLAVLKRVTEDEPRPIQAIIPEVPDWLCAIIAKLHAKKPADRFASAQATAGLLARCLSELQQHGNVEPLGDMIPMAPKPAMAKPEPIPEKRPKSGALSLPALDFRPPLPRRRWVAVAAMFLVLLAGLGMTEATGVTNLRGTVIRLFSPDGTLVVEVDDPGVSVSIDGEEMVITGTGAKEIRLKPGQYKVLASKDGKLVCQELVTVTKNGRQVVRVSMEGTTKNVELARTTVSTGTPVLPPPAPPLAKAPFDAATARKHQEAWAKHLGTQVETVNSVGAKMMLIPPGEFLMGSTDEQVEAALNAAKEIKADQATKDRIQKNERPQHKVVITKPFLMSATEVTIGQFKKFSATGYITEAEKTDAAAKAAPPPVEVGQPPPKPVETYINPGYVVSDDLPAAFVTWNDAVAYCKWLSEQEKTTYRLPTEAEWEYACRAGTTTQYSFGDAAALLDQYAWYGGRTGYGAHPVGKKLSNAFGLHDMHGNLYEWCGDYFDEKWYAASPPNDPKGPTIGSNRVLRGGFWNYFASYCRSATRNGSTPSSRVNHNGFRCVRVLDEPAATTASVTPAPLKPVPAATAVLEALRRDQISPEALAAAGDGDPRRAPASLVGVLGEPRPVHNKMVSSIAFSPDGRWLASGSHDSTIILEDVPTRKTHRVLKGHTGPVSAVAFSKDSQTLVSASHDGTLKLWALNTDAEPETVRPALGEIGTMSISPDGRFIAVTGRNRGVKLWNWSDWKSPQNLDAVDSGTATAMAFSADGQLLAVGWNENQVNAPIRLYRTGDGKQSQTLTGHAKRVTSIAFGRDSRCLSSVGDDAKTRVWDVTSSKVVHEFDNRNPLSVAVSPDGRLLAVSANLWMVEIYEVHSDKKMRTLHDFDGGATCVAFSPDGQYLAVGTGSGDVQRLNTITWEQEFPENGHSHDVSCLAISPDVRELLSGSCDRSVRRWNLSAPGKTETVHCFESRVTSVAYRPDGKWFAASSARGGILREVAGGMQYTLAAGQHLSGLAFTPDSKTLAVAEGRDKYGTIVLWDAQTGRELHRFPNQGGGPNGMPAMSSDGKYVAATFWNKKSATVWDVSHGTELRSLGNTEMVSVAFHPNGRTVATGQNGTITLWNIEDGALIRVLNGHAWRVSSLKFTPDGKWLVSSASDGTIRLWDRESERAREVIYLGPANQPLKFEFDPSGRYLFAAGSGPLIFILKLPEASPLQFPG